MIKIHIDQYSFARKLDEEHAPSSDRSFDVKTDGIESNTQRCYLTWPSIVLLTVVAPCFNESYSSH